MNVSPRSSPARVLVCDGEQRAALAVVRSLGQRGHSVAVCSHDRSPLAGASRWAARTFFAPNPLADREAYVRAVAESARASSADLIVPISDQSNLALLSAREQVAPARVIGPSLDAFERVSDKAAILSAAANVGIAVPQQRVVEDVASALASSGTLQFPLVIKPGRSIAGGQRHSVMYADNVDQLRYYLTTLPAAAFPVLLQQRIVGCGVGVFLLMRAGRVLAQFAHQRLREAPPSGGVSVYSTSIVAPDALVSQSAQLLTNMGFDGAAMVEFKRDMRTGVDYLMEINGRLWGSLQLAIDAGVDFPSLLVDTALGNAPTTVPSYRAGVRLRSWWGDFFSTLSQIRHSPAALQLPPNSPSRLGVALDFLRWSPSERAETLRWSDPAPFWRETMTVVSQRLRR